MVSGWEREQDKGKEGEREDERWLLEIKGPLGKKNLRFFGQ